MKTVALVVFLHYVIQACLCAVNSRNCKDTIRDYHECMDKAHETAQLRAISLGDAKNKVEACFTKNGCKKPSPQIAQGHYRPHDTQQDPEFPKLEQCRKDLAETFATVLQACVRKVIDDFDLPPLPFGNRTMNSTFASDAVASDDPSEPEEVVDIFEAACRPKGNKAAAKQCVLEVGNSTKPSRQELKEVFDTRCNAIAQCKKSLGKCDEVLKSVDKAICNCNNDISTSKHDSMWRDTPSCARLPTKPDFNKDHFAIDCATTPKDICDDNFDTFFRAVENF